LTAFTDLQVFRLDLDGNAERRLVEGIAASPITVTAVATIPHKSLVAALRQLADRLEAKS
jgi:hypothetical protein